jgi:hypothetical protein
MPAPAACVLKQDADAGISTGALGGRRSRTCRPESSGRRDSGRRDVPSLTEAKSPAFRAEYLPGRGTLRKAAPVPGRRRIEPPLAVARLARRRARCSRVCAGQQPAPSSREAGRPAVSKDAHSPSRAMHAGALGRVVAAGRTMLLMNSWLPSGTPGPAAIATTSSSLGTM